jgi:uncharacterized protein YgbK (DUF1537 family)
MTDHAPKELIVVLADDLTGAADTGIQFLRADKFAYLLAGSALDAVHLENPDVLAVYTGSRALDGKIAAQRVSATAEKLKTLKPGLLYKKLDSCMRGNVAEELDALLDALGARACFLAPAFPEQGRITVHGIHYLHGVPVAETEMARDPVTPIAQSKLAGFFAAISGYPVGRIDIEDYAQGREFVRNRVATLLGQGCRYLIFDADRQEHLNLAAELGLSFFPDCVFAGSAGLASGVAKKLGRGRPASPGPKKFSAGKQGQMLWLCGTASEKTAEQVQRLLGATNCAELVLEAETLAGMPRKRQRQLAFDASKNLKSGSLVIHISAQPAEGSSAEPEKVLQGLTCLTRELLSLQPPACIFLSGGDTADAVLQATGVKYIQLDQELISGIVQGRCFGGLLDQIPVVTKAGSFGTPEILLQVLQKMS